MDNDSMLSIIDELLLRVVTSISENVPRTIWFSRYTTGRIY